MSNYDGKIRIGLDLDTNKAKGLNKAIKAIESELSHVEKAISKVEGSWTRAFSSSSKADLGVATKDLISLLNSANPRVQALEKSFGSLQAMLKGMDSVKVSSLIDVDKLNEVANTIKRVKSDISADMSYINNMRAESGKTRNVFSSSDADVKAESTRLANLFGGVLAEVDKTRERVAQLKAETREMVRPTQSMGTSQTSQQASQQLSTEQALAAVEADQLRAVEKFNQARAQGLSISQALTQNEQALAAAYLRNASAEQAKTREASRTAKISSKVDPIIAKAEIDLAGETESLDRLRALANSIKLDFVSANTQEELDRVKADFNNLQNMARNMTLKFNASSSLTEFSQQIDRVKEKANNILPNLKQNGDSKEAFRSLQDLRSEITRLHQERDALFQSFDDELVNEVQFIAQTAEIDEAIAELENQATQINVGIDIADFEMFMGKFNKFKETVQMVVEWYKKLLEYVDYTIEQMDDAQKAVKKIGSAVKDIVSDASKLGKFFYDFATNATNALGVSKELKSTLSDLGFGDLVGANLLADVIREAVDLLKSFTKESVDAGSSFQSAYLRIRDTFGEYGDILFNYAKTSTTALGMSETAYLEAASKIGVFAKSYIKDTEKLANVTAGLTTAIADLSAQTGFTIRESMQKVLSGLRGNTEAIEELGINVKVKDMQLWMDENKIAGKFAELDSNLQNLYRTWYMLDKVASNGTMGYAQKMMGTFSGQVRILQAQFDDLKTTVGTYLMQALVPVLKVVNMLLSRLITVANTVGKAFGLADKYSLAESISSSFTDTSGVSGIYDDARESLSGVVDEQNKLTDATDKSAKAAKKALAPFHQLNILQNKDTSGGDASVPDVSGGGIDLSGFDIDFEEAEKTVDEWTQALKDAINNGDWYGVGVLLGDKIDDIVTKLDFKKYRDKLNEGAKNLAQVFNGLLDSIDFRNIGVKIADLINTVVSTINTFIDNINFENLGSALSRLLRGLLQTTDWEAVGRFWSQKTRVLLDILHGFVEDMNTIYLGSDFNGWQLLGESLGEFVNGVLDLEWERLGSDIASAINGIADTIITFNDTVDLEDFATRLVNGFNNMVNGIDSDKIAEAIYSTLNTVINSVGNFLSEANFFTLGINIGNTIGKSLANIDWNGAGDVVVSIADGILNLLAGAVISLQNNYKKIFEGVKSFATAVVDWIADSANQDVLAATINNFVDMLVDLVSTVDWNKLYKGVEDTLSKIDWADIIYLLHLDDAILLTFKTMFGKAQIGSVLRLIGEFFAEVIKEIGNFFVKLVAAVGILIVSIPATLMMKSLQIGASIIDGIIEGITGKVSNLEETFLEFCKNILDSIKEFFGIHSPSTVFAEIGGYLVDGLVQGIQNTWNSIVEFFSSAVTSLVTTVSDLFSTMTTGITTALNGLNSAVSTIWTNIKATIERVVNSIKTSVESVFNGLATSVSNIWTNLKTSVESVVTSLSNSITTIVTGIKTSVSESFETLKSGVAGIVENLRNIVETAFNTLKTNSVNAFTSMKDTIVSVFDALKEALKTPINSIISIVETMVNGVVAGINGAINALNRLSVTIPDWVPEAGGKTFGFSITPLSNVTIPRLAKGAVIKPNQRFLAELGDQTRGINIETPLETMLDAFRGALAESGYSSAGDITIPVYIGNEMLDEIIVSASSRDLYRNNGR